MGGILMRKSGADELEAFYPIRPECTADVPKPRFKPRAGKTLSARRWHAGFSEDGHLDIAKVLRRIQRGGVHPAIKGVVWEFLLGCFDPNSTFEERNQLRQRRREQYSMWKAECQNMVPVIGSRKFITAPIITGDGQPILTSNHGEQVNCGFSDKKAIQWMLLLHQIGLDVARTDRALVFYESEANQAKLWDILSVYAWMDNDIGYVQGMNDICSPMVILLENEADAFWCFERAMRRLRENFRCTARSMGVQTQLNTLSQIIKTVDPKLHQHLEDLDGGEYLFAFRMLMVLFRREFSFVDALYLWEIGFS
ncbi:TBC1 domain family member 15-like isoform X2 [Tripterygium wilfordii]|uniref:TBC1 domain family member 15-like isoform X2 n=1 Tax=Tripterygium wilfordii TaxID=458696 RepID=UPI0018F83EDE|nr:TBC1 domain family member 15-like isoform X2 [Tripterygium wilfordii]